MRKKGSWNTQAYNIAHVNAFKFSRQRYFKMLYILIYSFNWVIVYSTVHPLTLNIFVEFALCISFIIEWYTMLHLTYYTTVVVIYILHYRLWTIIGYICTHYHASVMYVTGNIPFICHTKLFTFLTHPWSMTRCMYWF